MESKLDPVLRFYKPGGAFLGCRPGTIYKIAERGLGYHDELPIREVMSLFLVTSFTHTTGRPGGGGGGYLT